MIVEAPPPRTDVWVYIEARGSMTTPPVALLRVIVLSVYPANVAVGANVLPGSRDDVSAMAMLVLRESEPMTATP
jgi:hypothetical protein